MFWRDCAGAGGDGGGEKNIITIGICNVFTNQFIFLFVMIDRNMRENFSLIHLFN